MTSHASDATAGRYGAGPHLFLGAGPPSRRACNGRSSSYLRTTLRWGHGNAARIAVGLRLRSATMRIESSRCQSKQVRHPGANLRRPHPTRTPRKTASRVRMLPTEESRSE